MMNRTTVAFGKFLSHRRRTRRCLNAHPRDGVSIVSTLRAQRQDFSDRKLYWEFFERGFQQAAHWRHWKAIRLSREGPIALYNLTDGPGECKDVAPDHPEVVSCFPAIP